jgi:peptide/nickel transport system substrate-binding protein
MGGGSKRVGPVFGGELTRRQVLGLSVAGAAGLWMGSASDGALASRAARPSRRTSATGEPVRGGTLVVGRTPAIDVLDPTMQAIIGFSGGSYVRSVFDVLLPIEYPGGTTPALATGFEVSADGLEITCELREDVVWHTGRDFVAEDVVWNFQRLKEPDFPGWPVGVERAASISEVLALDERTVRFVLDRPDLTPLTLMQSLLQIADPESADAAAAGETVSGTGPFMLEEFLPGRSMRLVRNPNYWDEAASYLDEIVLQTVPDEQALAVQLEAGDVHVAEPLPPGEVARLEEGGFTAVVTEPANAFLAFSVNVTAPPLDDRRVRQALMYAIDRERINEQSLAGFGVPSAVIWPTNSAAFREDQANAYPFDLDQARALLDEAGVSDAEFDVTVDSRLPEYGQMTEILRNDLAQIGVTLNAQTADGPAVTEAFVTGDYQLLASAIGASWLDGTVAVSVPNLRPNPEENVTGFANERYTELALAASELGVDEGERVEMLAEMTDIMLEEAFVLPVASRPITTATAANVHGVEYSPVAEGPHLRLRAAWLES